MGDVIEMSTLTPSPVVLQTWKPDPRVSRFGSPAPSPDRKNAMNEGKNSGK